MISAANGSTGVSLSTTCMKWRRRRRVKMVMEM
jgi:hypothetical protein